MKLPTDFILHIEPHHDDIEATWQGQLVRCRDCHFNYGNEHNCGFNPEDIVCTYWESDGLNEEDYCSQGISQEGNKNGCESR